MTGRQSSPETTAPFNCSSRALDALKLSGSAEASQSMDGSTAPPIPPSRTKSRNLALWGIVAALALMIAGGLFIVVRSRQAVSDRDVVLNIKAAFFADAGLRKYTIDVGSQNGIVTLAGVVNSDVDKSRALRIANRQVGVSRVIDELITSASTPSSQSPTAETPPDESTSPQRGQSVGVPTTIVVPKISYADFSRPEISSREMEVRPSPGFAFNSAFPHKYGGTWRIMNWGAGFTGTFTVPLDGQYDLVVTHGSSYDDLHRTAGYSPVTIQVNSKVVVANYRPPDLVEGDMPIDRWRIFAHAGKNTFQWTLSANATTHYWIQKIEIVPAS